LAGPAFGHIRGATGADIPTRHIFRSTIRRRFWSQRPVPSAFTPGNPSWPDSSLAEPVRRHKRIPGLQCKRNTSARPRRDAPCHQRGGIVCPRKKLSHRLCARWFGKQSLTRESSMR